VRISRQSEYGLAAILYLAGQPEGKLSLRAEIARRCGIPGGFLARILARLRSRGILGSRRGAHGGYFLRVSPQRLSLADVLEALEGKIKLLRSIEEPAAAGGGARGAVRDQVMESLMRLQDRGYELLRNIKIGELLSARTARSGQA
jgi:Rrf2 family protein